MKRLVTGKIGFIFHQKAAFVKAHLSCWHFFPPAPVLQKCFCHAEDENQAADLLLLSLWRSCHFTSTQASVWKPHSNYLYRSMSSRGLIESYSHCECEVINRDLCGLPVMQIVVCLLCTNQLLNEAFRGGLLPWRRLTLIIHVCPQSAHEKLRLSLSQQEAFLLSLHTVKTVSQSPGVVRSLFPKGFILVQNASGRN